MNLIRLSVALLLAALLARTLIDRGLASTTTLRVPQDYPTIQDAIDAAQGGDTVLVSPGTYSGPFEVSGKSIILTSEYQATQDPTRVDQTILDGQGGEDVVRIDETATGTQVIGFTIQNAGNGISLRTQATIRNNKIRDTGDGIDSAHGGGVISGNTFEGNADDAIDLDGASSGIIENNRVLNNEDDGIEVRLHDYDGPPLTITIRGNTITNNGEDGIQLVDYPSVTDRYFLIERNLLMANKQVAIGLMDDGQTREDYRGASVPERVHVFNNSFVDNPYAITGGDNLVALNNIFVGSSVVALKNVDASSVVAYSLFWNNGQDSVNSNVDPSVTLAANPLLDEKHELLRGSPAIDAGTHSYLHHGQNVLEVPASAYQGKEPDLGWKESGPLGSPTPTPDPNPSPPVILAAGDIANCAVLEGAAGTSALLDQMDGTVITLGDSVYSSGTVAEYATCYAPTWGRHRARTRPAPGNHDYDTPGAAGYFTYFGAAASPMDNGCTSNCKGYYSYDLGDWHIVALNSETDLGANSPQLQWLKSDLEAHSTGCTLAYWHKPRFGSGRYGGYEYIRSVWEILYEHGADVVLNAHNHMYERFAPQTPEGTAEPARGIRQFVVGTGGSGLRGIEAIQPNSEVRIASTWGVLKLTLHAQSYAWEFIPVGGQTPLDSGSAPCVSTSTTETPTQSPTRAPTRTPESELLHLPLLRR